MFPGPFHTRTGATPTQAAALVDAVRNYPVAKITAADMAVTTDQVFTWLVSPVPTLYIPRRVIGRRVSGAFGVACLGGCYTAASKGGTAFVAATQSWANLTAGGKIVDATLIAGVGTDIITAALLYFALTTANTGALTADIYLFADILG